MAGVELLERDGELGVLEMLVAHAAAGDGRVGLIEGPPGIGKTALVAAPRRLAADAGMRCLSARGSPMERALPFGVVRQLFDPVLAAGRVDIDVRPSRMAPAICALLGLSLTMAACGAGNARTAASPHAAPQATSASTTTTPGPSHLTTMAPSPATTPPPSISPASPPPATPPAPPGVVADCTSAPPHRLSIRPPAITLACADNGWGVEEMTWTRWATSAATGHGTFWDKLCEPSCASGKIGNYPVVVTLSAVKTSSQGPWFSRLTVTWEAARPPGPTPDSFPLTPPRN